MKFLVSGDWHADWMTAGVRRFEDVDNAAMATVKAAKDEAVDFYLFLGDLTDPDIGAFWANHLAIRVQRALHCPSYWLVGNHDVAEDGYGTHAMLPLAASTHGMDKVIAYPRAIRLSEGKKRTPAGPDVWLACFPYTSTARAYDPVKAATEMAAQMPPGSFVVVISHLMLEGIGPGSETSDMARGRDVFLPVAHIAELWPGCAIFNGHYHTAQTYQDCVQIPGSLISLTKGEIDNIAGYIIAEIPGLMRRPNPRFVQLLDEATRPKFRVEHRPLKDRDLETIGPTSAIWTEKGVYPEVFEGSIVWVKPPAGVTPELLASVLKKLKEDGAFVKLLPPDRVDSEAVVARPDRAPELAASDSRAVVLALCAELAAPAGVRLDEVLQAVEPFLSGAGL